MYRQFTKAESEWKKKSVHKAQLWFRLDNITATLTAFRWSAFFSLSDSLFQTLNVWIIYYHHIDTFLISQWDDDDYPPKKREVPAQSKFFTRIYVNSSNCGVRDDDDRKRFSVFNWKITHDRCSVRCRKSLNHAF